MTINAINGVSLATLSAIDGVSRASLSHVNGQALAAAESAWLTASTAGALRSNFNGWVGCKFTPTTNLSMTALGRIWLTGNSGTRPVRVYIANGALVASATIDLSAGVNDQYNYTAITPVALSSGQPYYISSQEVSGGLQWRDLATAPTTDGSAVCNIGGFSAADPANLNETGSGQLFVPVNFKHA